MRPAVPGTPPPPLPWCSPTHWKVNRTSNSNSTCRNPPQGYLHVAGKDEQNMMKCCWLLVFPCFRLWSWLLELEFYMSKSFAVTPLRSWKHTWKQIFRINVQGLPTVLMVSLSELVSHSLTWIKSPYPDKLFVFPGRLQHMSELSECVGRPVYSHRRSLVDLLNILGCLSNRRTHRETDTGTYRRVLSGIVRSRLHRTCQ